MHIGKVIGAVGTALALTIGVVPGAIAEPSGAAATKGERPRSVTLITGDQVIITGQRAGQPTYVVRPAAGREKMSFSSYLAGDHFYVIPTDAAKLVATDRLDRQLFDVSTLIKDGYDDASRATLPVIVTYEGAVHASVAGATVTRDLASINGSAIEVSKSGGGLWQATATAAAGIKKVWLDAKVQASLDRSVPQIGAPAAWAAGYTGTGVTIAVLDTGVDQTHPDLAGQEIAERNFSDAKDNVDRFGHGTHVASTAAGTGVKAGGKYKGVAFGAKVLDGKVLNDDGGGLLSWIIAGMEWAASQGAKVANLSLGGGDSAEIDPLEEAVNNLSAQHGILFVIAAGNSGSGPETVGSPGSADAALTVGAVDRTDAIADFSSRGPRIGDGAIKPDITAPGVDIVAAKAADGFIGTPTADGYVSLSGTSMATPHVAGSAALLAQQHPSWTGAQIKAALTASAKPNPALGAYDQGSGRVDLTKAIAQTITSEPTNASLGTQLWPHNDDQPVTKPLTYHNPGATDVTLNLAVETRGPGGQPAPGVFSLSANQITVPAGGQAQVSLTGDVRGVTADGGYTGAIVASSSDLAVRTPIGMNREVESYNLTVNVRGADGAPTDAYGVAIVGFDDNRLRFPYDPDGSLTVRLPKGQYFVDTTIITVLPGGKEHFSLVANPNTVINGDQTITAKTSDAKPIRVQPPDSAATLVIGDVGYDVKTNTSRFISAFISGDLGELSIGQLGPSLPPERLSTRINTQWTTPSSDFYGLAWFFAGGAPNGLTKVVKKKDLATVHAEWGSVTQNHTGARFATPAPAAGRSLAFSQLVDVSVPGKRTEFYNTDGTVWRTGLLQFGDDPFAPEVDLASTFRTFKAGHTYRDRFNHAVFGPAFPAQKEFPWAARFGDVVFIGVPMFSDSSGNSGFSVTESASSKLFRNGELINESSAPGDAFVQVPPDAANYRLSTETVRPAAFDLTTKISATWTFRSGHASEAGEPLPLSAIRFTPTLDDSNSARAGRPFLVPVALQLQSGSTVRPRQLSVDVSYDEGKTWEMADVSWNLVVRLHHRAKAKSVSLRAKATDRDGNTVEQTIIRAYKLR